jgi:hypothetical protein
VGTFDGSRDLSNPNIFVFQLDEVSTKWSGGSEISIKSSSFSFKTSFSIEVVYSTTKTNMRFKRKNNKEKKPPKIVLWWSLL